MKPTAFWSASVLFVLLAGPVSAQQNAAQQDAAQQDQTAKADLVKDYLTEPEEDIGEPQGLRMRSIDGKTAFVRWEAPLEILDEEINGASCSRPNRSDVVCFFPGVQWVADLGETAPRFETALIFRGNRFFRFTVDFDPNLTDPVVAAVQSALGEPSIQNSDSPGTRIFTWDKPDTLTRVSEPASLQVTYKPGEIVDAPPLVVPF